MDEHTKTASGTQPDAVSNNNSRNDYSPHDAPITVAFTRFESAKPLSKTFALVDRSIVKTSAAQMTGGVAHRIECGFADFGKELDRMTAQQATGYGLHDTAQYKNPAGIVVNNNADPPQTIARTKAYFNYRAEPGVLMLDHDWSKFGPSVSAKDLQAILAGISPAFGNAACWFRGSVSSGVCLAGQAPKESANFHLYYAVPDASDIPRFGAVLYKRLWLAGQGYIALAKDGSLLERTLIDGAVFSPERLDFTGKPVIESRELEYTPPKSEYRAGGFLDTKALLDLSTVEEAEYQRLVDLAKAAIKPEADKARSVWIDEKVLELEAKGTLEPEARKHLERLAKGQTRDLPSSFLLHFANLGTVTVAEVPANLKKYDGQALADPIEGPEYGQTTAKFYANAGKGAGKPCINSFAHGAGTVYFLKSPEFFSDLHFSGVTDVTDVTSLNSKGNSGYICENPDVTDVTGPKIPTEFERPCYQVFDEPIKNGEQKLRAGVWYFSVKYAKNDVSLEHKWVCSPLYMEAVTRDGQDNNFGRLLRFRNTLGHWREWPLPMDMLKGSGEDLRGELLSMGVHIDPKSKNELNNYLQSRTPQRRIRAALQVGWHGANFVLPDCVFGPGKDDVIFQSGERNRDEHTVYGTLDGWRSGVSVMAVGNPLLMLGLSSAFAGPLLAKCHAEGGGLHFAGDSSTGKTTIIDAACSVWGGKNYKRSWRATANGIEGAAVLFSDCLLALDEISECDPREIGKIVYSLGNGYGKQRASRSGAAREVARWLCFILSSGERSIETAMLEGGLRSKAGQEIRLLTVPASGTHGAWDDLKGFASGAALSDAIKTATAKDYGHAGRAFLDRLTYDKRDFPEFFEKTKACLCGESDFGGQDKRAAARFAVVALAGELATEYGITCWTEGDAIKAVQTWFKSWRDTRQVGNDEIHKMVEQLTDYIEKYGDGRFTAVNDVDIKRLPERSGYWQDDGGKRQFLFNAAGLKAALVGFDYKRALKSLSARGVLPDPDERGVVSRIKKAGPRSIRLYPVSIDSIPAKASV